MKNYLLTLITRFFVVFSGFFVFVVTSKLYGAEGRGVIGFGTSVVSFFGLLFSFNLGRSFLSQCRMKQDQMSRLLPGFLNIHYLLFIVTIFISAMFFYLHNNTRIFFDSKIFLSFLILAPFYVWSVSGNIFFAALNRTSSQDFVICITRILLIFIAFLFFILNIQNLTFFIFAYAFVLSLGAITEMVMLGSPLKRLSQINNFGRYVSDSWYFHLDYLAFNLYPVILMIFSGSFLPLYELGRLNFLIQLINFIFIVSVVASIRLKTYVANKGAANYYKSIKKLLFFTLFASVILVFIIFFFLKTNFFNEYFSSFNDLSVYFLIISLAVPGYLSYQFTYPILIEYNLINLSMKINLLIIAIFSALTYPVLELYGFVGSVFLFALFYLLVLLFQFYIYKRIKLLRIYN